MIKRAIGICPLRSSNNSNDMIGHCGVFHKPFELVRRSWPVGVVALLFGSVYCSLVCFLTDGIDAFDKMSAFMVTSRWGGVEDLFLLNSIALGWVSVVVSETRTGTAGFVPLLMALAWCLVSIGGAFALGSLWLGRFSGPMWGMVAYSVLPVLGAAGVRCYLGNIR